MQRLKLLQGRSTAVEGRSLSRDDEHASWARESIELSILPMLALVERRITKAELDQLDELGAALSDEPDLYELHAFRLKYWAVLAGASHNPIMQRHLLWWLRAISELEAHFEPGQRRACIALPSSSYRGLSRKLRDRKGAVAYWLKVIEPLFEVSEARSKHRV